MMTLKVTKILGLHPLFRTYIFGKITGGGQIDHTPPPPAV